MKYLLISIIFFPLVTNAQTCISSDSTIVERDSVAGASEIVVEHTSKPTIATIYTPMTAWGGWSRWNLHKGLNVQIDAGVTMGFGKNNPMRGASFFTDVSLLYAQPVNDRLTVALGGTLSRFRMFNESVYDVSLDALAAYRINENLTATIYASHSRGNNPFNASFYGVPSFIRWNRFASLTPDGRFPNINSTTIGAQLDWKVNENVTFSFGMSRTENSFNNSQNHYNRQFFSPNM